MLIVVVFLFATLWLPYRVLVVYNSFAKKIYLELWYLMFSKTLIYVNSAINPVLYNAMSIKFRRAFRRTLTCGKHSQSKTPADFSSRSPAHQSNVAMGGTTTTSSMASSIRFTNSTLLASSTKSNGSACSRPIRPDLLQQML